MRLTRKVASKQRARQATRAAARSTKEGARQREQVRRNLAVVLDRAPASEVHELMQFLIVTAAKLGFRPSKKVMDELGLVRIRGSLVVRP